MDCDQVFAVLTRGPFPSGSPDDDRVEQHLAGCPGCWRIAEALRPARDVFHEALSPAQGRDLPGYWGEAPPPGAVIEQVLKDVTVGDKRWNAMAATHLAPLPVRLACRSHAPPERRVGPDISGRLRVAAIVAAVAGVATGIGWWLG